MATLSAKPGQRLSVSDWQSGSQLLSSTAEHLRLQSQQIRQEGRALRNETTVQTRWDEQDSQRRLTERVQDVSRLKEALELCLQDADTEIEALSAVKGDTESLLAAMTLPLDAAVECLTLREGRRGDDLVRDAVEVELKKEVEVIGGVQRALQQRVSQAFEQICLLQEARQQLVFDLQNKSEALGVDQTCLSLTVTSPLISLKPNPSRVPNGSTSPQQWEQFSQYNRSRAQEEMKTSLQLREAMRVTISQTQNELEAQRVATDFALRKRSHELERAREELLWQQRLTQKEAQELEQDIRGLERDLKAKTAPLKLAHTRLETRTTRPGVDLCRDQVYLSSYSWILLQRATGGRQVQYGLVDEVTQLEATITALKQKLAQSHLRK
ncbi:tektin-2 isoform X3 [Lepisosteus oculatus]|uniref:tektin-2 isoform X3 n=1 Tax=Lepisosteus oculatus TaxID=7918 RepID=UPI00073FD15A|nr:PREDICTED: tektin-2 isoform X3 [Lepisosteus oculatus]